MSPDFKGKFAKIPHKHAQIRDIHRLPQNSHAPEARGAAQSPAKGRKSLFIYIEKYLCFFVFFWIRV
jgi:hypothetical protein